VCGYMPGHYLNVVHSFILSLKYSVLTVLFLAPEILDNKAYGQLCDVWAMGVIMYSLLV